MNERHGIDLHQLFKRYFQLCDISQGQQVAVLSGASAPGLPGPWSYQEQYVSAAMSAAADLGVNSFELKLPPAPKPWLPLEAEIGLAAGMGSTSLSRMPTAVAALSDCDFVLDLTFSLFSPELDKIRSAGAKFVMICEPPEALLRLFPSMAMRRAVENGKAIFAQGPSREMHVSSKHGTNLTMAVGELLPFGETGYAASPGDWDCFPSGQIACCPDDGSANGTIVISPGDQILLPYTRYVDAPVTLRVSDGYITSIDGGTDAILIREIFERLGDPEAYAIGHQSIGLHPRARWDALAAYGQNGHGMDGRVTKGGYLLGTGPNTENGGTRNTPLHFDIAMRDYSVVIDSTALVKEGRIVNAEIDVPHSEIGWAAQSTV